jgi:hypothetical protein
MLSAIPRSAFAAMIRQVGPARRRNKRFLKQVAAAAMAGGMLFASCDNGNDAQSGGADPDADTDDDTDADTDTDTDTDSDADGGPDAGDGGI